MRQAAQQKFGVTIDPLSAEVPPRTELGDLAFPVAFELAKKIKETTGEKRAPRAIAEELKAILQEVSGIARIEIAGPGYLNVFFDRPLLMGRISDESSAPPKEFAAARKLIVEHTNINPNKAAHIGHLRNAVLGDTFVRILRAGGEHVEVQNYIDNTGVQVADVLVGFKHIERMTLADIKRVDAALPPERKFDYYCWDLYARVGLFYRHNDPEAKEDPQRLLLRTRILHDIEAGDNATAELAEYVATRIVNCHLDTMERLDIRYDLLPRESEILHLRFWDHAFARLKETGAIRYETEGRNSGCWVMPTDSQASTEEHEADKVIVRSNNTVTYAGKDIAYQLWKLGRLGLDFFYQPFRTDSAKHTVWITSGAEADFGSEHPRFGSGQIVYNVIDSRQSYTQDVVRRGVAAIAPEVGEEASVHLSYEMVALSPAACLDLGIELSADDRQRPYIEMSGRKGLGVKADDLITRLIAEALKEVQVRHPDLLPAEQQATATIIAVGALRYFLLKWTRNTVIAFRL
ncbi:MAG: arginine--tRNA ligase [Pyrinomonadaceae bacterium]